MRQGLIILVGLCGGCASVPAPSVSAVDPGIACVADEPTVLRIAGEHFDLAIVDALTDEPRVAPPEVSLVAVAGPTAEDAPPATARIEVPDTRVTWIDAEALEVEVDASLGLEPGVYDVVVKTLGGGSVRWGPALTVLGPPRVDGVDPFGVCVDLQESPVRIVGAGFVVLGDDLPLVQVGDDVVLVVGTDGCAPLLGPVEGQVCTALDVDVDPSRLGLGDAAVRVTNPAPVACGSREALSLLVLRPPEITAVTPEATCASGSSGLVVTGANFVEGTTVAVGGLPAASVVVVDEGTLHVLPDPATPEGSQPVSVGLPYGCTATLEDAVRVVTQPIAFYVDPPAVLAGVSVEATLFVADVVGVVTDAWLEDPTGLRIDVDWWWDPENPAIVRVLLPPGLTDGDYVVKIAQDGTCAAEAGVVLHVEGNPEVALEAVEPGHAWTYAMTPVDIRGPAVTPALMVGFEPTPRAFLVGPDGAPDAYPMLGVGYKDYDLLSAMVPYDLPLGAYDLFVVNPDATVGLLADAVTLLRDPPPTIAVVGPATLPNKEDQDITVRGRDFRDPTVSLSCREFGVITEIPAVVTSWAYGVIEATVQVDGLTQAVCVVDVVNADGTQARWSAMSVTNPAQNLFPWRVGTEMVEVRRAPAAAAGRATSVDRYVYAIGGDDGTAAGARSTVEVAPVGVYGDMGPWEVLPMGLPEPRTLATALTIDRFVYVVGGNDGQGPVDTVLRAHILSPLQTPLFQDLSVRTGDGTGLQGGTWTYRISAVYGPAHPANPDGESLASAPVSAILPDVPSRLWPEIVWTPVNDAVAYRIYRTPEAGDLPGSEELLAEVTGLSFVDYGGATEAGHLPLPPGSLGVWVEMPAMSVPRESPCIATARESVPDRERRFLYAAGGKDDGGQPLASVEVLPILVSTISDQQPEQWAPAGVTLSLPRYQCGGYSLDDRLNDAISPGETWIYFAGGRTATSTTGVVDAGLTLGDGTFDEWTTISNMTPRRAGFAYAGASNFLYVFGGVNGEPATSGASGHLDLVPDVENWNGLGSELGQARYLPGSAQESAVIFVVGGQTDLSAATRTTDYTNY